MLQYFLLGAQFGSQPPESAAPGEVNPMAELSSEPRRWIGHFLAVIAVLTVPAAVLAQQIPQQELQFVTQPFAAPATVRVHSDGVQMDVVVRDAKGHLVSGLTRQDFEVYDKGKLQRLAQFTIVSAPGAASEGNSASVAASSKAVAVAVSSRYIGLFFDDRSTPFGDLRYAQNAAEQFVQKDLHIGDKVGVFTASGSPQLDFSDNKPKLLTAIESVRPHVLSVPVVRPPCVQYPLGPYASYLIVDEADLEVMNLYTCHDTPFSASEQAAVPETPAELELHAETILSSANIITKSTLDALGSVVTHLAEMSGSRILVLASSGFFTDTTHAEIDELTNEALAGNVVINSLDAKGLVASAPGEDVQDASFSKAPASEEEKQLLNKQRESFDDVMVVLARDTGGIFFHNNNDLDFGLREMAAVPDVSYRLGFSPTNLKPEGEFHALKVKLAVSGPFQIQSRRGYFAPTPTAERAEDQADAFKDEIMKSDQLSALPAEVGAEAGRLPGGGAGFQISLRVDPRALSFRKDHGKHLDQLNLITALFDRDGNFVTGESGEVRMALSNHSLNALTQRGLNATIVLQAPGGNYRLRVVIEDVASGKTFAASRSVTMPR